MTTDLTALRKNYSRAALQEKDLPTSPISLFSSWLQEAISQNVPEPYAMTLATCGSDNKPTARTVLLRGFSDEAFVFYTNYASLKAKHLSQNPYAELLFFWHDQEQQVRVSGKVTKLDEATATAYYHKRPHDSQVGAWVSQPQSGVVASRDAMEKSFNQLLEKYPEGTTVPKPDFWGGYGLQPESFEFWQGRPNRMHDRIVYKKTENSNDWVISRLLP